MIVERLFYDGLYGFADDCGKDVGCGFDTRDITTVFFFVLRCVGIIM